MALPALALGALLVTASAPAVKYKASARIESVVRTPLVTETAATKVVSDVMIAPRLDSVLYTSRMELKFVYEPQFWMRQVALQQTFESLQSVFTQLEYALRRDFKLLAVHTTTFGSFPLNDFGGSARTSLPVSPPKDGTGSSAYIYTETALGFVGSFGIKRLNVAGTLGWVVNGLLDPPVRPTRRGNASYPQQRYPELRMQSFYGATRRDYFTLYLYGRDVSFSTGNRDAMIQFAPGLQHQFNNLVDLSVDPGVALGRIYPRRPDQPIRTFRMPTLDVALNTPVPVGLHWPVKAKVRLRYLPYIDPLTTQLIPRGETGVEFKWEGRREAKVLGKAFYSHALTSGPHRYDNDVRLEAESFLPLPHTRSLVLQTKGQFRWTHHVVLPPQATVQWALSVGLVVRYDRGRL